MQKNLTFRTWAPHALAIDNSKRGYKALQSCKAFCISLKKAINSHVTICHQLAILLCTGNDLPPTSHKSPPILINNKSISTQALLPIASLILPTTIHFDWAH